MENTFSEESLFKEYVGILDSFWFLIEPLIKIYSNPRFGVEDDFYFRKRGSGAKPKSIRKALNTILFVLIMGKTWQSVNEDAEGILTKGSNSHVWHLRWYDNDFYHAMNILLVAILNQVYKTGIDWQAVKNSLQKGPFALECEGRVPAERAKKGLERSVPLFHDKFNLQDAAQLEHTLSKETLEAILNDVGAHLPLDKNLFTEYRKNVLQKIQPSENA
ncbi:MAG: hypothetical protein IJS54_02040 [Desulfovibrio sp.]|nr:hypothetical protein [Desulfovibrio sp.]